MTNVHHEVPYRFEIKLFHCNVLVAVCVLLYALIV